MTVSARAPRWRDQPGWDPSGPIGARLNGADLAARSRAPVDLRLQVDGEPGHIWLNLDRPHGKREAGPDRPGALRPSVAAALVRLALQAASSSAIRHGLYDPCCGTGAVVARRPGCPCRCTPPTSTGDAVAITAERLAALAGSGLSLPKARVFRHDLLRGIPREVPARSVASNLPWGEQVELPGRTRPVRRGSAADRPRDRRGRGQRAADHGRAATVARIRRQAPQARISTRRIGLLGQTPAVVLAQADRGGLA